MSEANRSHAKRARFKIDDTHRRKQIRALQKPDTLRSIGAFCEEWTAIAGFACGSWLLFTHTGTTIASMSLYLLSISIITIRMRALENLIHESTHGNLCRNRQVNDGMAWVAAALPLGHNVETERKSHCSGHHPYFWDAKRDPDLQRYNAMGVEALPADNVQELIKFAVVAFPAYSIGAIKTFLLPRNEKSAHLVARLSFWIAIFFVLITKNLMLFFSLYWLVPFILLLPVLRFIGEISEHAAFDDYSSELVATRNNLGWFNEHVIHPRGDAYHIVHHLFPTIPFHKLKQAHQLLMLESEYREKGTHALSFCLSKDDSQETTLKGLIKSA